MTQRTLTSTLRFRVVLLYLECPTTSQSSNPRHTRTSSRRSSSSPRHSPAPSDGLTSQQIAANIVGTVVLPATNNKARWDRTKPDKHYHDLAKNLDIYETQLQASAPEFDDEEQWWIDCGLMATLVDRFNAGNCDDLPSYALNYAMRTFSNTLFCYTQHTTYNHSFLLVMRKGDEAPVLADVWVSEDGAIPFLESLWCEPAKKMKLRVMPPSARRGATNPHGL